MGHAVGIGEGVIDLIFRPSPDAARQTVDLTQIYSAEIIIKDVRVFDESVWMRSQLRNRADPASGSTGSEADPPK